MFKRLIYRSLCLLDRWQGFMRARPTPLGRLLMAFTLAAGVFGVDTRMNLLHQAFALGLGLLLFSSFTALLSERRLRARFIAQRQLPRHATMGQPFTYTLQVRPQQKRWPQGCFIEESLPEARPSLAQFRRRDAESAHDSAFDRLMGYPLWRRISRRNRWAEWPEPVALEGVTEQGILHLRMALKPLRRGRFRLSGPLLTRPDPLGLFRSRLSLHQGDALLVLPQRYAVAPLHLPGRRRLQPGGMSLAASVGDSQEFIGLREYRPGDSPRAIHWPSWARSGKPQVREYQDEYFNRLALVFDNCSDDADALFEAAVSVAASLCEPLQQNDSLLDLLFVADRVEQITAGRGLAGTAQLLEILACIEPAGRDAFAGLQRRLLGRLNRLSALVLVLSHWDSPRQELVTTLRSTGLSLRVLLVGQAEHPPEGCGEVDWLRLDHLAEDLLGLAQTG